MLMRTIQSASRIIALPLVALVFVYQKTLSPDHSWVRHYYPNGYCRYSPSCSTYAKDVLKTDGVAGIPAIVWRVARCNPWSRGGLDHYHSMFSLIPNHK